MKPARNAGYRFRARHDGQELAAAGDLWDFGGYGLQEPRPGAQTVFFTDRAIYRPGQTIQYKGICLWVDQTKDNYEVLKGEQVTVVFRDVNGKEVARQQRRANDYGSFAGSFTAPRDRLMGQMTLQVEGRAQGAAYLRVEEYKRPKFEVTLDAPKTAAKLNEAVSLTGHAMNYTGAAVDGAAVKYRVVREVRMPWWWGWWRGGGPQSQSQEITHGTARTATDGTFKIEFAAKPDPKVPEKDEPTFVFQINADVTDGAGETRSADHAIRVGYTALEAMLSADDWQTDGTPVELKLDTKTLDGEPQVAEGSVKIYDLQAPEKVHRAPLTGQEPWRYGGEFGGGAADEGEPGKDLSNPNNWPLGKVVAEKGFTTGHQRSGEAGIHAGGGGVSGGAGDAGSLWQESHRPTAPPGVQARGAEAGHQDSATAGGAGLGSRSPARSSWRSGGRVMKRAARSLRSNSAPDGPALLDQAGPNAATDQAGRDRSDARRVLRARYLRPREPGLPPNTQSQRAVEEQGAGPEMGAFRLQAPAGTEGNLDAVVQVQSPSPKCREGGRGNGGDAL